MFHIIKVCVCVCCIHLSAVCVEINLSNLTQRNQMEQSLKFNAIYLNRRLRALR